VASPTAFPPTEPLSAQSGRLPWRKTFIALEVPNFRIWTIGNMLAMTASWTQRIASDWLVLELTGSATAVGVTVAMQFAPMLFFGLLGGVLVDRHSKRMLMMITQALFAVFSLGLAVLIFLGVIEAWHVFVAAFIMGMVTVVDNPARQVIVTELVGQKNLRNAISINSSVFQLAGMIGPALAGVLLLTVGAGPAFVFNGVACLLVILTLAMLRTDEMSRFAPNARAKGQLKAGLRYAVAKPTILYPVILIGVFAVFGLTMPVTLAAYAADVFAVGPGGYGLFNSMIAVGALVGALLSTRRSSIRLRTIVIGVGVTGLLQAAAGLMPTIVLFSACLVGVGLASLLFLTASNSLVQMSSNIGIRGRVMSIYVLVLLGGQAIGGPLMGIIVEQFGAPVGMVVSGGVPALAAGIVALVLARRGQLRLEVRASRFLPSVRISSRNPKA
jgi:MFS family permease